MLIGVRAICPPRKKIIINQANMDGILNLTITNNWGCPLVGLWASDLTGKNQISYEAAAVDYYGDSPNPFSVVLIGSPPEWGAVCSVYSNIGDLGPNIAEALYPDNRYSYITKNILSPNYVLNLTIVGGSDVPESRWFDFVKPRADQKAKVIIRLTDSSWPNPTAHDPFNKSTLVVQVTLACGWSIIIGIWICVIYRRRQGYRGLPSIPLYPLDDLNRVRNK